MPVTIQQGDSLLVDAKMVDLLWAAVREETGMADDEVTVRCVSEEEINKLNQQYRNKDKATNVLTFSYGDGVHDIALCLAVAEREAQENTIGRKDYEAWLLVHAFLHVAGMDHVKSDEEAGQTKEIEKKILAVEGFNVGNEA